MSDTRITALPAAGGAADADVLPLVQPGAAGPETRRATLAQLRAAVLADRPAHVRDFGAVGDGATDDAPAFQAAIDALGAAGGGTLQLGARRYRIASPVVVNGVSVTLQGAGFTEGPNAADGTWLLVDTTGFTPFTFTGTGARGSAVRDLAVRQAHAGPPGPGWAPTAYDWVFRVVDCLGAVDFENVFLCAVNRGILCDNSGRLNVQRLRGQVFTAGVEIDRCLDIPRLHHVHFWTFWSSDADVIAWQQANTDALVFRRVDGVFLDDIFVLGARSMLRFSASASGTTRKFYLGSGYGDFARHAIWVDGNNVIGQVANLTAHGEAFGSGGAAIEGSTGLQIDGSGAQIQVGNLFAERLAGSAVRVNGAGNRLDIFALRADGFNRANNGSAAVHVSDAGAGAPNQVHLGTPPIVGNANGAPLASTAGNAVLAQPVQIAPPAGGLAMVNELRASGGGAAQHVGLSALGADANIALRLGAKGNSPVQLTSRGAIVFEGNAAANNAVNYVRASAAPSGSAPTVAAIGQDANIALALVPKGGGAVAAAAPLQLPSYTVATLPGAAGYPRCLAYVSDGAGGRRLAVSDGAAWRWPDGAAVA